MGFLFLVVYKIKNKSEAKWTIALKSLCTYYILLHNSVFNRQRNVIVCKYIYNIQKQTQNTRKMRP